MTSLETRVWSLYAVITVGLLYLIFRIIKSGSVKNTTPQSNFKKIQIIRTETKTSGLKSDILIEGQGPKAKYGNELTVHYTAFLTDGLKVDSSHDRGKHLVFKLGTGKVIDGWEQALVGAQAGETRKVTVPSKLAYGRKGSPNGNIPPNADVIFEIELIKIN